MSSDTPQFDEAAADIRQGKIVGVPTDTVYGLAVDPQQAPAVLALFELKGRPHRKPIGLLGSAIDQFEALVELTASARDLAYGLWPGPLTLVVRSRVPLPDWVGDHSRRTVAIRVPDHPLARAFFSTVGPLAVTSANLSGRDPAISHEQARAMFGNALRTYLPGNCPGGSASTVVDVSVDPPRILREGPIKWDVQRGMFVVRGTEGGT